MGQGIYIIPVGLVVRNLLSEGPKLINILACYTKASKKACKTVKPEDALSIVSCGLFSPQLCRRPVEFTYLIHPIRSPRVHL